MKVADRLRQAASADFVGREKEKTVFRDLLSADDSSFTVLFLFGPGGVGKTSLVNEFRRICQETDVRLVLVDGRTVAGPTDVLRAVRTQMGTHPTTDVAQAFEAVDGRLVLVLDTLEEMAEVEPWLVTEFLPSLSDRVRVVLSGRYPPSDVWSRHPGWRSLLRVLALRNLSPPESRQFLTTVGVPEDQQEDVMSFTHGHPLALALYGDVYRQGRRPLTDEGAQMDIVRTLLNRFVMEVPSPAHRSALEASAL
ncbi:MAG: AAA family ATPase, partial [Rhodothermales bacterium]|nr:AAA family ATPase [Rhodothermales bacterium]